MRQDIWRLQGSYDNAYHSQEQLGNEVSVLLFLISSMPAKRTYDVDAIIISKHMSKREQKIFTLLKEGREYKFIAKQFNLAASDVGKIVRKYLSKNYGK